MKKTPNKILAFCKRNAAYLVLVLCILAIGLSVTFMLVNKQKTPTINQSLEVDKNNQIPDTNDGANNDNDADAGIETPDPTPEQPVDEPISFIMPVASPEDIGEYTASMVFNQTLNRFESHMAMDFFAPEGTEVYAVEDGTIESVENTLLHGTTIIIDHGKGVKTIYNSLLDGDKVTIGQQVKQGDVIGEVSTTNRQEYKMGPHLHFSATENGETIDPMKYLVMDEK